MILTPLHVYNAMPPHPLPRDGLKLEPPGSCFCQLFHCSYTKITKGNTQRAQKTALKYLTTQYGPSTASSCPSVAYPMALTSPMCQWEGKVAFRMLQSRAPLPARFVTDLADLAGTQLSRPSRDPAPPSIFPYLTFPAPQRQKREIFTPKAQNC